MIIGIVAIAKNFAIGKAGKLPWHYSSDLKFFKQTTLDNAIVMGRKTFDSIGKPLPNRLNIVLSRTREIENPQLIILRNKEAVLELAKYLQGDLFIIGGASIYQEFADVIERWIVTEIPLVVEDADAFMPKDFLANFTLSEDNVLEENLVVKFYQKVK
ncbi:MAG TPA: dihydrofolate reductase [Pyrinomonadaceae bacterium]|nr:dihydrofolate reductase [Pyrinomonadaceae bacterium]